jgi:hypothetical protein
MVHHEFSEEGRKARFEQWEKYGADRLKNDLQTDPYRRVHRRRRRASSRRASRPKSSSQVTLCWREMDSNHRYRIKKQPFLAARARSRNSPSARKTGSFVPGPMVRIHLPPAGSHLRT